MRIIGTWFLLLAITLLNLSAVSTESAGTKVSVVVIDAGHGGKDPGTRGKAVREKDVALKISLLLGNYI